MISLRARRTQASLLALSLGLAPLLASQTARAQTPPTPKPTAAPKPAEPPPWHESPAADADPPLMPAPVRDRTPISTSGTEIVPAPEAVSPGAPPRAAAAQAVDPEAAARITALEERLARAEAKLEKKEQAKGVWDHLTFSGFVQPQLLIQTYNAAASPNRVNGQLPAGISSNDVIALPDGTTTNGDYFRLRRTRLRAEYETSNMAMRLEIDPFPIGGTSPGIGTIVRNAEAVGIAHWTKDVRTEFSAGVFLLPVRLEFLERSYTRPFIERSFLVNSLMPNGRDLGVHARTVALKDKLVVDVGVVNGQSLDEPYFASLPDLNHSKDFFGQATYDFDFLKIGASGYVGTGQNVDTQALRVKNYTRWMGNLELFAQRTFLPSLGRTSLWSELTFTQNMDPGRIYTFARPAMPVRITDDVSNQRGRGFYVRVEQELKHFLVGYRFDTYTPNGSIQANSRDTHAFVVSYNFSRNLRWMNELDYAIDHIHAATAPSPSRHILMYSTVLQAMF